MLAALALTAGAAGVASPPTARATFPGDNGRLIVLKSDGSMWTVAPDGSDSRKVSYEGYLFSDPAFSPAGDLIAYRASPEDSLHEGYGIWVMKADGTDPHQVTRQQEAIARDDSDPTWAPSGKRIAFVRGQDLYVMSSDGTEVSNLTAEFGRAVDDPEWSPDGQQLVWSDGFEIYSMNVDGTSPTTLTPNTSAKDIAPTFSPDSARIAWVVGSVPSSIWVMDRDGSNKQRLVGNLRQVWDLAWSPDGRKLAFVNDSATAAQEQLYTMDVDGSGIETVIADPVKTALDWGIAPNEIKGSPEDDKLRGTPGADVIYAGGGDDVISGAGGNDIIYGGAGVDQLAGAAGADSIFGGGGADELMGDGGNDRLVGGKGSDRLVGDVPASTRGARARSGSDYSARMTAGDDVIVAGPGNDLIDSGGGADDIVTGGGADVVRALSGKDSVDAGEGYDRLLGGGERDRLLGRRGKDVLKGGAGADLMNGGPGFDICFFDSRRDRMVSCERKKKTHKKTH